jgi:sugar-specific transcriptional regulator TrmB
MTELVGHLMRLGLSEYEARAYIATVALGEGTVKEISVESGVPRSRAYDVMEASSSSGTRTPFATGRANRSSPPAN